MPASARKRACAWSLDRSTRLKFRSTDVTKIAPTKTIRNITLSAITSDCPRWLRRANGFLTTETRRHGDTALRIPL